jgi:hypothetical protein
VARKSGHLPTFENKSGHGQKCKNRKKGAKNPIKRPFFGKKSIF